MDAKDQQNFFDLAQADCIEWLAAMPSKSVDLIITDPAYQSLEKHRKIGTTTRLNNWFEIFPNSRYSEFFKECYRVLKPNTHLYLICDSPTAFLVKPLAEQAGFTFWKPLVWNKVFIGMGYHYRAQSEFILFFEKGHRNLKDLSVGDILTFPAIKKRDRYPTEKPVGLLEVLINQSSKKGDLVIDPFCGSGSTGVAAIRNKRNFRGCDISSVALALSQSRLASELGQFSLVG